MPALTLVMRSGVGGDETRYILKALINGVAVAQLWMPCQAEPSKINNALRISCGV